MNATFTAESPVRSLRLRVLMEEQQKLEIGQRIKELRDNSAETNRSIAEFCGVGERSVASWIAGKGLLYDNASRVADLFDVDVDWIWRGREKAPAPDPFATAVSTAEADLVASELAELRAELSGVRSDLQRVLSLLQHAGRDPEAGDS